MISLATGASGSRTMTTRNPFERRARRTSCSAARDAPARGTRKANETSANSAARKLDQRRFDDVRFLFGEHRIGEVTLARIATDRYDRLPCELGSRRDLKGGMDVRSRGDADEHAFLARRAPRHRDRVFVRDADDLVVNLRVEDLRYEAGTGSLNLVRSRFATREHGR